MININIKKYITNVYYTVLALNGLKEEMLLASADMRNNSNVIVFIDRILGKLRSFENTLYYLHKFEWHIGIREN